MKTKGLTTLVLAVVLSALFIVPEVGAQSPRIQERTPWS